MLPKTLSATALQTYESCPARYRAENIERTPDMSGSAASLGSAGHGALEEYVKSGDYLKPSEARLLHLYDESYWKLFADRERYDEGAEMLKNWFQRTDLLDGREILSTEVKENFLVKVTVDGVRYAFPVTYIWDRCDRHPDGSIEVVDYKSFIRPVQPEDLKKKIQPRLYALAAAIKYPEAPEIWVGFDLLRYDYVAMKFSREDNLATWDWLKGVAKRIVKDEGTTENLNPECRWCVRALACDTLTKHAAGGGSLSVRTLDEATDKRAQLSYAQGAINAKIAELDKFIFEAMEEEEKFEHTTETTELKISGQLRREVDSERAAKLLGPEIVAQYAKLNISAIDAILKTDLDPDVKRELKEMIRKRMTQPTVKTAPLGVMGED